MSEEKSAEQDILESIKEYQKQSETVVDESGVLAIAEDVNKDEVRVETGVGAVPSTEVATETSTEEQPKEAPTSDEWYNDAPIDAEKPNEEVNPFLEKLKTEYNVTDLTPEKVYELLQKDKIVNQTPEQILLQNIAKLVGENKSSKEIKSLFSTPIDSLSAEEILEWELRKQYPNLKDEELDEAYVEEYGEMGKHKKERKVADIQERENKIVEERLANLRATAGVDPQQRAKQIEERVNAVTQVISSMENTTWQGLPLDKPKIQAALDYILHKMDFSSPDKLVQYALNDLYGKEMVKTNVNAALSKGRIEGFDKLTSPSKNSLPSNVERQSTASQAEEDVNRIMDRQLKGL